MKFRTADGQIYEVLDDPAWEPIETAPKDGAHVLLSCVVDPPRGFVCEGYYEEDGDRGWFQAKTHWTDHYDGSVIAAHWMPLPSPPKE